MTSPSDQTSFMPLASGPQQPAYWQPPTGSVPANGGWGQPAGPWPNRPVAPAQEGSLSVPAGTLPVLDASLRKLHEGGGRRPPERRVRLLLIGLVALMAVAAGLLGVLYVGAASDAATATAALADAQAGAKNADDARLKAEDARNEAEDQASTAADERDAAQTTAQNLQECQQAARDLLVALNGPDNQATTDAATEALTRMASECQ
jgi:hypothetical protein